MHRIRPPFKITGGKFYLCPWVIEAFPANYRELTYVEPYAGSASVLINKDPSPMEVLNDLDDKTIQIFRALRDEPHEFIQRLSNLKYSADTLKKALRRTAYEDYLDQAVNEFVIRRMSRKGVFAGDRKADLNAWISTLELLPKTATRLKPIHIFNKKAVDIVKTFNSANALVYCDPPPVGLSPEMDNDGHIELSKALHAFWGKVVITGVPSPLYNKLYKGWSSQKKKTTHNGQIKVEVLWKNF